VLGNDEFLDEMKHRAGEHVRSRDKTYMTPDIEAILKAAEKATSLHRQGKNSALKAMAESW
jgi:hypothetical protein